EARTAIARIEELVREAQTTAPQELAARHAELFAENVESDFPLSRRIEYLKQALVNVGQLQSSSEANEPNFERPSCARCSLTADLGRLELYIELIPVAPYSVQTFSAEVVNGSQKVKLF